MATPTAQRPGLGLKRMMGERIGHVKPHKRRIVSAFVLALLLAAVYVSLEGADWVNGHVFVSTNTGQYHVYSNSGLLKETIFDGLGGFTTGCAFDSNFDLYTTNFANNTVVKYAGSHPHGILQTINTSGDPESESVADSNESIVFAANGDFYVGHADGNRDIQRYNSAGVLQATFDVATEVRGSDWIDLSNDQVTMFYTSEGRLIKRFDVSTNMQLADFGVLPGTTVTFQAFALRLLPPGDGTGGLLVADRANIKRLDGSGGVAQTYDVTGEDDWFALSLDPNRKSFWSGTRDTGNFYRFNIATGAVEIGPINSGPLFGLCVKNEPTAAAAEICNDGIDNDFNGLIDGNDPDCQETRNVVVANNQAQATFGSAGDQRNDRFTFPAGFDGTQVTITETRTGQTVGQQFNGNPCAQVTLAGECIEVKLEIVGNDPTLDSKIGWTNGLPTNPRLILFNTLNPGGVDITTSYNAFADDPVLTGESDCCSIFKPFDVTLLSPIPSFTYILPFFNDGTYKLGRVIPIKGHEMDDMGVPVNGDRILISIAMVDTGGGSMTPIDVNAADAATEGNQMRNVGNGDYHFNWQTKGLQPGTYNITFLSDKMGAFSALVNLK